jgi:hypothetical protein
MKKIILVVVLGLVTMNAAYADIVGMAKFRSSEVRNWELTTLYIENESDVRNSVLSEYERQGYTLQFRAPQAILDQANHLFNLVAELKAIVIHESGRTTNLLVTAIDGPEWSFVIVMRADDLSTLATYFLRKNR